MQHRVVLTVNLGTLAENYRAVCGVAAPCAVMPVLKANAYGLGVGPIAKALVAEIGPMIEAGVTLPLVSLESARDISAEAVRQGRTAVCHLALDTGMGRAGFLWDRAPALLPDLLALPNLNIEGLFTHFPLAYESASAFTQEQLRRFRVVLDAAEALGHRFRWVHAANSDAINNAPAACAAPFNLVRCGINLHGAFDAAGSLRVPLRPVLTMTTRLAQIRDLPEGTPIGYGHTYRTRRPMRVGTVCAGYADGLPRRPRPYPRPPLHGLPHRQPR